MKKLTFLFLTTWVFSVAAQSTAERKKAVQHLKQTSQELMVAVKGLNENQLNYKTSEESWSIAECLEHLAISEKNLMGMVQMSLKEEADASKRSDVAMSDDQLLGLITSREQKVKTRKEFEPVNSFGSFKNTLNTFKERRKSNMEFVKTTDVQLRDYYLQFPFGLIDAYQGILFMSGHTTRHTNQIKEIMESEGFPG